MKPQDIIFLIVLILLIFQRNYKLSALAGISSLLLSIPLFYFWIFFTAQRLVMYAAGFILLSIILLLIIENKHGD